MTFTSPTNGNSLAAERHKTNQRVVPVGTGETRKIRLCTPFSVTLSEKSIFRESSRIPFFPQYGGDPPTKISTLIPSSRPYQIYDDS